MKLLAAILAAFALSAVSAVGFAAEKGKVMSFSEADKDKSGAIEQTEAAAVTGLDFTKADKDKDGKLNKSEYESAMKAGAKK